MYLVVSYIDIITYPTDPSENFGYKVSVVASKVSFKFELFTGFVILLPFSIKILINRWFVRQIPSALLGCQSPIGSQSANVIGKQSCFDLKIFVFALVSFSGQAFSVITISPSI